MSKTIRALALLARIIGRKHGIEVLFDPSASTASTDGQTIILPQVSTLGDEDHAILIEGLVDHEAMHCRWTDFGALGRMSPFVAGISNLLEDVWGEREQAKIYPGCWQNIQRSMAVMISLGWYRGPQAPDEPIPMRLSNWLINGLLARHYRLEKLQAFADEYRVLCVQVLGDELVARIWETACQVDRVMSTQAALDLAKKIEALLRQRLEQLEQEREKKAEGGSSPDQVGGGTPQASPDEPSQQAQGSIQQILEASADQLAHADLGDRMLAALSAEQKAGDAADDPMHAVIHQPGGASAYSENEAVTQEKSCSPERQSMALEMARPIEVKLGTKLEALLETRTDSFVLHKRSGRKLASRRAPRITLGQLDVFERREEGDEIDTAVAVVFDGSGSMFDNFAGTAAKMDDVAPRDARITSAAAVTYAAGQVLERHAVPFSVTCFGTEHVRIKTFDERWATARRKSMIYRLGGTMTDWALMRVADELLLRHESRKLVILVTDGEPRDVRALRITMDELRKLEVEFAVLFIGGEGRGLQRLLEVGGYHVARASTPEELAASFFDAVARAF